MFKLKHFCFAVLLQFVAIHFAAIPSWAHTDSQAILNIIATETGAVAEFNLPLGELTYALGLDRNSDGEFTLEELHRSGAVLSAYLDSRVKLASESATLTERQSYIPCARSEYRFSTKQISSEQIPTKQRVSKNIAPQTASAKPFLTVALDYHCRDSAASHLYYGALFDTVANHSALVAFQNSSGQFSYIHSSTTAKQFVPLRGKSLFKSIISFVVLGIWHILIGYDHILFVLALIIPVSIMRRQDQSVERKDIAKFLRELLKVVTAFTLAHSISLIAATLGLVELPSPLVETLIAVSLVVAGLSILLPFTYSKRWLAACGFGFIHGFGFASVLAGLIGKGGNVVADLLAFNLGVELGQLVIIAVALPLLFAMQTKPWYRRFVMPSGAIGIALMGALLTVQRL